MAKYKFLKDFPPTPWKKDFITDFEKHDFIDGIEIAFMLVTGVIKEVKGDQNVTYRNLIPNNLSFTREGLDAMEKEKPEEVKEMSVCAQCEPNHNVIGSNADQNCNCVHHKVEEKPEGSSNLYDNHGNWTGVGANKSERQQAIVDCIMRVPNKALRAENHGGRIVNLGFNTCRLQTLEALRKLLNN